jgi:hypothetical protein
MSSHFYAMPDEQKAWFERLFRDEEVWICVSQLGIDPQILWTYDPGRPWLRFAADDKKYGLFIDICNKELCDQPIWRPPAGGNIHFDATACRAVRYWPSVLINEEILLLGGVGKTSKGYLDDRGIDEKPLIKWYERIVNSIKKMKAPGARVVDYPENDEIKGVIITPGAVRFRKSGGHLKSSFTAPWEYNVLIDSLDHKK